MSLRIPIRVANTSTATGQRPVTGGVPIGQGEAPANPIFVMLDQNGQPIPTQTQVTAKWPDGSARWVLIDFLADPPAGETQSFTLCLADENIHPASAPDFGAAIQPCGDCVARIDRHLHLTLRAVDAAEQVYRGIVSSFDMLVDGAIRKTFAVSGSMLDENDRRWFGFRTWIHVFAGTRKILIEPLLVMDAEEGLIQKIKELALDLTPHGGLRKVILGGTPGFVGQPSEGLRLFQIDDQQYTIDTAESRGTRAPGWMEGETDFGRIAVAMRDFWQQWPKSLEANAERLTIGLLPRFQNGAFDHMQPWYKYDYLFEGDCYRIRTGQARRWQVWLEIEGEGTNLAAHANSPLVPFADPGYAISTGVWGQIAPAGACGQETYDEWSAKSLESHLDAIEHSRDYGAMNWGDWFGERKCNWANNEYDTARQLYVHFARTGDPRAFHRAFVTARHTSEVDIIHHVNKDLKAYFLDEVCRLYTNRGIRDNYPIRPGMVHAHCVGHVGGFHPVEKIHELYCELNPVPSGNPYLCLDPYNISHLFTHGMVYHYLLTADPWVRSTLDKIGDNLAKLVEYGKFPFAGRGCEAREYGWPIIALCALYELEWDARYIRAARTLVDQVLALQDPGQGGWLRRIGYGTCACEGEKHEGEATFLSAIRINALCRYYKLSGDERVLPPIKRAVDQLIEDRWNEEKCAWRHTACPKADTYGHVGVVTMAIANAVDLFGDANYRRILQKSMHKILENPSLGKGYGPHAYGTAEAAAVLGKSG